MKTPNCYLMETILVVATMFSMTFSVHAVEKVWPERIRGLNTGGPRAALATEKIFKKLDNWNVNLIRLNFDQDRKADLLNHKTGQLVVVPEYMKPYQLNLTRLDKILALCKKYKIYMIICAAKIVGRDKKDVAEATSSGVNSVSYEKHLLDFWKYIAMKYKDNPMLIGYDLLNEPHTKDEMKYWQKRTVPELVKVIRAIDRATTLVIEPGPWGLPGGFSNF